MTRRIIGELRKIIAAENNMKIVFIAGPYSGDGTFEAIERNIREAEKYQIHDAAIIGKVIKGNGQIRVASAFDREIVRL